MRRLVLWLLFIFASSLVGCGESQTVTVGKGEAPGVYERSIEKSRGVAAGESARIKTGEKDFYGG